MKSSTPKAVTRVYEFTDEQRELLRQLIEKERNGVDEAAEIDLARELDKIAVALGYKLEP